VKSAYDGDGVSVLCRVIADAESVNKRNEQLAAMAELHTNVPSSAANQTSLHTSAA
jgi:hypothetical protein